MNIQELAEQISVHFSEQGVPVPAKEVEQRLISLVNEFKVPIDEAKRSVISYFAKRYTKNGISDVGDAGYTRIAEINAEDKWINLKVKVVQLWEPNAPSIAQVGLLGDESGAIKFTSWASASLPIVQEGRSYSIRSAVTKSWQGRFSVSLNKATSIVALDEEISVGRAETEKQGAIIDVQSGSGLIKRCPECNRVIVKGYCAEHGKVNGVYDLRVKGVLDDGDVVTDVLFNKELTEGLTGITLDEAKEMAIEALDHNVVADKIKSLIIGRYYVLRGNKTPRWLLVTDFAKLPPIHEQDIQAALERAEGYL